MRNLSVIAAIAALIASTAVSAWCASGDLDPTFGADGYAVASFAGSFSSASCVARQADGKLIAAGNVAAKAGQPGAIAVARFTESGVLDTTFDSDGEVTTDIGAFDDSAVQVLIQSDGKIVVVGRTEIVEGGSDVAIVLVRYETNGDLDNSFGTSGVEIISLGAGPDVAYAGALQSDDKIVVVGSSVTAADAFVARFDSSGGLDATFGAGGFVTLDFGGRGDVGRGVVVQPDGYIVVATTSYNGPLFLDGVVASLSRLDDAGTLDPTFGSGGSVIESSATINLFDSLVIQGDGKLVVFGADGPGAITFRLYRYDASGIAEGGFVGGPSPFFRQAMSSGSLALGADGRFAMLGDRYQVMRVESDGAPDADFGVNGAASLGIGSAGTSLAVLIEPSGDVIMAGGAAYDYSPKRHGITLVRVADSSAACTVDADCRVCEICAGSGFCMAGSRSGCVAAGTGNAALKIVNNGSRGKSKLSVKWGGAIPSFDPTGSDDLTLCIYQADASILEATAPAGGTCGTRACWSGDALAGFSYLDKELTPDGVKKLKIRTDSLKGKAGGPALDRTNHGVPVPSRLGPESAPVLMQIHTGDAACIEATFDTNRRPIGSAFKGKND